MSDPLPPITGRSAPPMPQPDEFAQQHSERLIQLIQQEINEHQGCIPFDRYMELALYAPGLGYYTAGARKFGEAGDFITAPESSPLFARCLARQVEQVLRQIGGGSVLEVGAGSGLLAADMLCELEALGALPNKYLILELSPELKQRQRQTIEQKVPSLLPLVEWLDALPESEFEGVVVANELLDAMPVSRVRLQHGEFLEQVVLWQGDKFAAGWQPCQSTALRHAMQPVLELLGADVDDYETEINLRMESWLASVCKLLSRGALLLIDYGYPRAEYYHPQRFRGTLMCHYRHRAHDDPFVYPGLQDITAHVDFTAVATTGITAGFTLAGYTTQAYFLMATGLDQMVGASDPNDVAAHMQLVEGVKRLTLPSEMGEKFKVIALGRELTEPLMGFSMRDLSERL